MYIQHKKQFKTASADIPAFGTQELNAYWDTAKVIPGAYKLDIVLNYLGQKTEKIFDIMVEYHKNPQKTPISI